MYVDRSLAGQHRGRTAHDHGVGVLLDAWAGSPPACRAAMVAAQGDLARAAACAGGAWQKLLDGDVRAVLDTARKNAGAPGMGYIEAEALFSAGAVTAGLAHLEHLHRRSEPAATLALARRCHQLGDHIRAVRVAKTMPWHAHAALLGARSALAADRPAIALRLVEPYLEGHTPLPEPAVAGAFAVTTAATLARLGEHAPLRRFVDRLLPAGDLAEDMMPAVARAAWIGGRAREAWRRFDVAGNPWCIAARLELAILAGDADSSAKLLAGAGPLGIGSRPAVELLQGRPWRAGEDGGRCLTDRAREVFAPGRIVHIWRTHPHRWQPWIEAALLTPAQVVVCDLAANELPDAECLPWAVLDDGALVGELAPVVVEALPGKISGARMGRDLCRGLGIGHDWPCLEDRVVRRSLPPPAPGAAAVEVLGADAALAKVAIGRPLVVIAPPGDPFWAGPVPERVWPSVRVVRYDAEKGWTGGGDRVIAAAEDLVQPARATARAERRQETVGG